MLKRFPGECDVELAHESNFSQEPETLGQQRLDEGSVRVLKANISTTHTAFLYPHFMYSSFDKFSGMATVARERDEMEISKVQKIFTDVFNDMQAPGRVANNGIYVHNSTRKLHLPTVQE